MTYNRKITIQSLAYAPDGIGQQVGTWSNLITVWAAVNCIGGKEYYAAAQSNSENDMIFKIRYCAAIANITPTNARIVYDGKTYNIKHIDDYMQQHRDLTIRAAVKDGGI